MCGFRFVHTLSSGVPDEFSTDMTNSSFQDQECTFSDSFCITADSSLQLFSAIELLSFLACWPAGLAHVGTAAHCAITCNMHSKTCGYTVYYTTSCTLLSKLQVHVLVHASFNS